MTMPTNVTLSASGEQIAKAAIDSRRFGRPVIPFINARTAFKAFMLALGLSSGDEVLLPAYVGWSTREGSGVFDPVQEMGVRFRFYAMTDQLAIDIDDLNAKLAVGRPRLLLLIHYFGFPDSNIVKAVAMARKRGALILEDEAHALYSDWIGGVCGRFGDAAILSLHKMLPFQSGGLLVLNSSLDEAIVALLKHSPLQRPLEQHPMDYDLWEIAASRRVNAGRLQELLPRLRGKADPLYSTLPDGVVPQTLPVIITGRSRDEVYFELNARGYGVVTLYHTLVGQIRQSEFPVSHWLARRILNLPVHQDVRPDQLESLVAQLVALL
jgi:dTDP-4-amino-4,6-dideoxygalactose transaminase